LCVFCESFCHIAQACRCPNKCFCHFFIGLCPLCLVHVYGPRVYNHLILPLCQCKVLQGDIELECSGHMSNSILKVFLGYQGGQCGALGCISTCRVVLHTLE
jgi:hypothetical protein